MVMTQIRRRWTYKDVEAAEHGAEIPVSPNRFRDWPANSFRPHEGPRTVYLFANGSAPATDNRSGASGLDLPGCLSERGHRYRCPFLWGDPAFELRRLPD